jgi:hypothetical protein
MIYKDLHELAECAVSRMVVTAQYGSGDLTDFHERQLVHALFAELDSRKKKMWAAFEYGYYREGEKRWLDGKADLSVLANGWRGWFEVKSTGLNPATWDNSHNEIWAYDVGKLCQVRDVPNTQIGWVWLFLFETYRKEVMTIGPTSGWSDPKKAEEVAPFFGRVDTKAGRLAKTLNDAAVFAKERHSVAIVTLQPNLTRAKGNVWENRRNYSALILTMDLTRPKSVR